MPHHPSVFTRTALAATALVALGTGIAPALAASAGPLSITTQVLTEQRHAAPDGTTRITLAKPTRVSPGDGVVVSVHYRNTGTQALGDVILADPLPPSITYRGPRAGSPEPEVSADGRHYAPLSALVVPLPAGGTRPARLADVTAVRWRLLTPLAPGGQGDFAFQGTLK